MSCFNPTEEELKARDYEIRKRNNKELSFSEVIQKSLDKINKRQAKSQDALKQAIERAKANGTREQALKNNQINILDLCEDKNGM